MKEVIKLYYAFLKLLHIGYMPSLSTDRGECHMLFPVLIFPDHRTSKLYRITYCSALYVGALAQLECVLHARLVGDFLSIWPCHEFYTRRVNGHGQFDHVMNSIRDVLHWLPVSLSIEFRISVWMWWSQLEGPNLLAGVLLPHLKVAFVFELRFVDP